MTTDAQGKASLSFIGQSGLQLRVEADGFLPGAISVPAAAVAADMQRVQHRRELQLKADLPDENTPVRLRFRLTEAGGTAPVSSANVKVSVAGRVVGEGPAMAAASHFCASMMSAPARTPWPRF